MMLCLHFEHGTTILNTYSGFYTRSSTLCSCPCAKRLLAWVRNWGKSRSLVTRCSPSQKDSCMLGGALEGMFLVSPPSQKQLRQRTAQSIAGQASPARRGRGSRKNRRPGHAGLASEVLLAGPHLCIHLFIYLYSYSYRYLYTCIYIYNIFFAYTSVYIICICVYIGRERERERKRDAARMYQYRFETCLRSMILQSYTRTVGPQNS